MHVSNNSNTMIKLRVVLLCCIEIRGDHVAQKPIRQILQWRLLHHSERKQHYFLRHSSLNIALAKKIKRCKVRSNSLKSFQDLT